MKARCRVFRRAKAFIAPLLLAAFLAGCVAAPRYQTVTQHVSPEGPDAQACLARCAAAMEACQQSCAAAYQACAQAVLPDVQARHAEVLRHYEAALAGYRWELERYRMDLMLGWGDPYWGPWGWGAGWYPPFPPSAPPPPPTLEQATARLTAERCDRDCGCQSAYDSCFLGCGGRIVQEIRCIAHCPETGK